MMALDKVKLKTALVGMFKARPKNDDEAAGMLAEIFYDFVKSAEVTITALPSEISVEGTAAAQANIAPLTLKGGDTAHAGGLS